MFSPLASTRNFLITIAGGALACVALFFLLDWSVLRERARVAMELERLSREYADYNNTKRYAFGPPVPENVEALRNLVSEREALLEEVKSSIGLERSSLIPSEGVDDLALWWTTAYEKVRAEVLARAQAGGLKFLGEPNLGVPGGLVDQALVPRYAGWLELSGLLVDILIDSGVEYVWDVAYEVATPDEDLSRSFENIETTLVSFKCYCTPEELARLLYNLQRSKRLLAVESLSVAKNVSQERSRGSAAASGPVAGLLQVSLRLKTSQLGAVPAPEEAGL